MRKCTKKLRQLRLDAGMSQNQMARAAGLDRQTISNAERGAGVADLTVAKLRSALTAKLGREVRDEEISTEAA
jgi:transcriptional regulator with XRE-family HTH domain